MAKIAELIAVAAVELFLLAIALGVLYRIWGAVFPLPKRQVVSAFQKGVVLRGGAVERVLAPGNYLITPRRTLVLCDVRPKPFQVPAQELLTAEGAGIRVSLGG
jgi:regulator of protease activity HflC (stomatin/prohibitin superfamily)